MLANLGEILLLVIAVPASAALLVRLAYKKYSRKAESNLPSHARAQKQSSWLWILAGLSVLAAYSMGAFRGWFPHFPHDELTTVQSGDWAIGEYKRCSTVNAKTNELYLECDPVQSAGAREKVFKVRFNGQTYVEGQSSSANFSWNCRKNGDDDPTITCESVSTPPPGAKIRDYTDLQTSEGTRTYDVDGQRYTVPADTTIDELDEFIKSHTVIAERGPDGKLRLKEPNVRHYNPATGKIE